MHMDSSEHRNNVLLNDTINTTQCISHTNICACISTVSELNTMPYSVMLLAMRDSFNTRMNASDHIRSTGRLTYIIETQRDFIILKLYHS